MMHRAVGVAKRSVGLTQPHPNHGCVLVSASGDVITEAFLRAQGAPSAEYIACSSVGEAAVGGTAYVNLETGMQHCLRDTCVSTNASVFKIILKVFWIL